MTAPATLRRTLGFTDLVLIAMGTVIGSGIYGSVAACFRCSARSRMRSWVR
jgi:amino acid transporter